MTPTPNMDSFRPPIANAAYGPDGNILETSVCQEIAESVKKAEKIEKDMANSKVN